MLSLLKGKLLRTLLVVAAIELLVYYLFQRLPLDEIDINFNKMFIGVFLYALFGCSFLFLIGPYLVRFSRDKYQVDQKGISVSSLLNYKLCVWKNILRCQRPQTDPYFNEVISLAYYTKQSDKPRKLVFEKDQQQLAENVYEYMLQKIPPQAQSQKPLKPKLVLNKTQHTLMVFLAFVGALFFVYYLCPFLKANLKDAQIMALISMIFLLTLGPGLWGLLLLFGKELFKYRDWFSLMCIYNFLALVLSMMGLSIKLLFSLYEVFEQNPI